MGPPDCRRGGGNPIVPALTIWPREQAAGGRLTARQERGVLNYGEGMPDSVRSIGAGAALNHDGPDDPEFAVVDIRLFALTSAGEQVDDPQPASISVRCERSKLSALELSVLMSLRLSRPPTGTRLAAWERICPLLAERGIQTDPATLHAMTFRLTPDDELRNAQQAVWPT